MTPPCVSEGAKSVTEEDESYAKATTGPPVNDDKTADSNVLEVLGSIWNVATVDFTFDLSDLAEQAKLLPTTKRSFLKISAKIFDPLGLLSPFTIQWKVLFQALCKRTDWDEQLSDGHLKRWNSLIAELQTLNSVRIPRCYFDSHSARLLKSAQLHCFSDASERAYAAVIYLRSLYEDGHVEVTLTALKTNIAPLKKQSDSGTTG